MWSQLLSRINIAAIFSLPLVFCIVVCHQVWINNSGLILHPFRLCWFSWCEMFVSLYVSLLYSYYTIICFSMFVKDFKCNLYTWWYLPTIVLMIDIVVVVLVWWDVIMKTDYVLPWTLFSFVFFRYYKRY